MEAAYMIFGAGTGSNIAARFSSASSQDGVRVADEGEAGDNFE
jgi:hypothetical protein